jgi:hypothetical protein
LIELCPFEREVNANSRVDVKKIVTIVFLAEMLCFVLGTTSAAEAANIESVYLMYGNQDSSPVAIPLKSYPANNRSMSRSVPD